MSTTTQTRTTGDWITIDGDQFYRIEHIDQIPVFLMSIVSTSDHWMFVASNGGITAGRKNADNALFPYETEDKIAAHRASNGGMTLVRVTIDDEMLIWEPFADARARRFAVERHLYKNVSGTVVLFEEYNTELGLRFRTRWSTGDRFGVIRSCAVENVGSESVAFELLDGIQNIMPTGVTQKLQTEMSSLLNAYKRNELDPGSGMGIYSLSATLTDRAEPSESLMATVVWQTGLDPDGYLLTATQVPGFIAGDEIVTENDVCGRAGSYLTYSSHSLQPGESKKWYVVADINQDSAAVSDLRDLIAEQDNDELVSSIENDIEKNEDGLRRKVASTDGLQTSADQETVAHHFANVMFNIMRGGLPADGYRVSRDDFIDFVAMRNRPVLENHREWFNALPTSLSLTELYQRAITVETMDLQRICYEYLPITFSRRHGDPSRPWNKFSIDVRDDDGSPRFNYQGNWRDIFQNWEPLAASFPHAIVGVIAKFLNATTIDGYNPYRVTRDGIEWEVPEPENPWSNIGYWSDHQIIYLLKLLEMAEDVAPGTVRSLTDKEFFSTANVPYRIKPYGEILADWYDTITFDHDLDRSIEEAVARFGTDARLVRDADGNVIHVSMTEKLLVLLLAKLTNLVPDGGIWMNTQRPEWNDANNALVGKGMSVVTTAYLYRFVTFWLAQLPEDDSATVQLTPALATMFTDVQALLEASTATLENGFDDTARRAFMDRMGAVATEYRNRVYTEGIPESKHKISIADLRRHLQLAGRYLEHTLRANQREDGLYHSYNILNLDDGTAAVEYLYEMLEGQVAIISSGLLSGDETVNLVANMRKSALYRADQHSYMLYPRRQLADFRTKNTVSAQDGERSALIRSLVKAGDRRLLSRDHRGRLHFNGRFRNAVDVQSVLDVLETEDDYAALVAAERDLVLDLFEKTFNHRAFTGRSGTFFAYEGLGSIYWHMVSKLLLAVQEIYLREERDGSPQETLSALADGYYDIRAGLGFNKTPEVYGAFPTDPYSHTPWGAGARQPGMTGQVKEEILTRWGELGVSAESGRLRFAPSLLCGEEFSGEAGSFTCLGLDGNWQTFDLPADALAFTYCQTPVVYELGDESSIAVERTDGSRITVDGNILDGDLSDEIMGRTGSVALVRVGVNRTACRVCRTPGDDRGR